MRDNALALCCLAGIGLSALPCFAGEPSFPPVARDDADKGLVFQVATTADRIKRAQSLELFYRFLNVGEQPISLVVDMDTLAGVQNLVELAVTRAERPIPMVPGIARGALILRPGHDVVFFAGKRYLPPGHHKLRFEYRFPTGATPAMLAEGTWQGSVKSNLLDVTVEDVPLTEDERKGLERTCAGLLEASKEICDSVAQYKIQNELMCVSPYSIPVLKRALRHRSSAVRNQAVIALGRIAQKGIPAVERDTSAFKELCDTYGTERNRDVRASMASALFYFSDAIDARQRDTAVDLLRGSLGENRPIERLYAALSILEIDPRRGVAAVVEKVLEGNAFQEEARTIALQALERTTGARFVGNDAERLEEWWNAHKGKWCASTGKAGAHESRIRP